MLYKSLRLDKLERHLQIITSFANPWKTNFATTDGPEDANKVWQLFWHWRGTSRDLQDTFIRLQTCLLAIHILANVWGFDLFVFKAHLLVPRFIPNIKCFMGNIWNLCIWGKILICDVSKIIPNLQSVNLLDVKNQHHYLQILLQLQLHNDHRAPVGQTWGLPVAFEVFPQSILCLFGRL